MTPCIKEDITQAYDLSQCVPMSILVQYSLPEWGLPLLCVCVDVYRNDCFLVTTFYL